VIAGPGTVARPRVVDPDAGPERMEASPTQEVTRAVALPNFARFIEPRLRRPGSGATPVEARAASLTPGPSMRILEALVAIAALGTAVLIGLPR